MYTWEAANDDEITIISYDDKECAVAVAARLGGFLYNIIIHSLPI